VGIGTPNHNDGGAGVRCRPIRLSNESRYKNRFVGVAGFDRDGQRHGDVVVSSSVVAYATARSTRGGSRRGATSVALR